MAAPRKPAKPATRSSETARIRLQLNPQADFAKRFRLAAVSLNLSETELFERLVDLNFPGLHLQNLSRSPFFGAGQGGLDESEGPAVSSGPTVRIAGVSNRIGEIARRASAPVDDALDNLASG
jgi:hypothetical protein